MENEKILDLLKETSDKDFLKKVIDVATTSLNSTISVGDDLEFIIDYMIGDSDGYEDRTIDFQNVTQDQLDALKVVEHILDNHTVPNKGTWGFILSRDSFSQKPKDVYNILYNQKKAPGEYEGVKLTPSVLEEIQYIVEEGFYEETEYSFLVYQGCRLIQSLDVDDDEYDEEYEDEYDEE